MKRHKILIVDDQRSSTALIKSYLTGYEVMEAEDGRTALKKVAEEKPDLILLDVLMPGMDGYSVLSILKNSEKTRLIPVILVTSLNGLEDKIKSLEKGADEFISKPVNPLELQAKIKNLLRITFLQDELENVHNMLILVVMAVESKHPHLADHSRRTSFYAEKLAQRVYSTSSDRKQLKLAGLLHDIGKVAVAERVFLQPGELAPEDFELVKAHPAAGERICAPISALKPILPCIRHHHEHFDGSGYPDALKERDIPLGARILAIADAFDALTSPRPYREAYSQEKAAEILASGAGKQWDPLLVEKFLKMIEEDKVLIRELSFRDFEQQYMFK